MLLDQILTIIGGQFDTAKSAPKTGTIILRRLDWILLDQIYTIIGGQFWDTAKSAIIRQTSKLLSSPNVQNL